jgi:hypothetical protein
VLPVELLGIFDYNMTGIFSCDNWLHLTSDGGLDQLIMDHRCDPWGDHDLTRSVIFSANVQWLIGKTSAEKVDTILTV